MAPTSATKDQTPAVVNFVGLDSPTPLMPPLHVDQEPTTESPYDSMRVNAILYSSAALALLLSAQIGWSVSQLNVSTFQDQDDCDARPVAPGTCLMFPGHSKSFWTWVVNLWTAGGVVGSIGCAKIADRIGRKKALTLNAILMIVGAIVQATASSLTMYAVGRFVSGVVSGAASSVPNSYINEISPPHLRNRLGSLYQISICIAIIFVGLSFFFANTSVGWRYIGGFPVLLAGIFLLGAPTLMVESPAWLLEKGRREEAECEITRLFGERSVDLALLWLNPTELSETTASKIEEAPEHEESAGDLLESPWKRLFSAEYRQQTLISIVLSIGQQLSGINVVFIYSSSMFTDAGLDDDRIGSMIVNIVNLLPALFAGDLGSRYGNRRMILFAHVVMILASVGIMIALSANSPVVSIIFTALYVAAFATSLGPLIFVVLTAMFPHSLRATGMSLCLCANWLGQLLIGVGYPYVSDALGDLSFLPFVVLLSGLGLFHYKLLPETAGKTNDEVQDIFRRRRKAHDVQ